MLKNFEEEYKKELLVKIRENINIYNIEFQSKGNIEYLGRILETNNFARFFGTIWIILIIIISFIIYKQVLININNNISLFQYMSIIIFILCIIILLIFHQAEKLKRISKLILNKDLLVINYLKSNSQIINEYKLNEFNIFIRRKRETVETNTRHSVFYVYITYNDKKNEYIIDAKDEPNFFVFLLFLDSILNNININELTDEKLYDMYHSKYYGLKYNN